MLFHAQATVQGLNYHPLPSFQVARDQQVQLNALQLTLQQLLRPKHSLPEVQVHLRSYKTPHSYHCDFRDVPTIANHANELKSHVYAPLRIGERNK
jgi:hypothetical protein